MKMAVANVREFMTVAGQDVFDTPTMPDVPGDGSEFHEMADELEAMANRLKKIGGVAALRMRLIVEEVGELMAATAEGDAVEAVDALADICYVTVGGALAFGLPLAEVWNAVQHSNMAKFPLCWGCADAEKSGSTCPVCNGKGRVVMRDGNGKVMKPAGWKPPDVARILQDVEEQRLQEIASREAGRARMKVWEEWAATVEIGDRCEILQFLRDEKRPFTVEPREGTITHVCDSYLHVHVDEGSEESVDWEDVGPIGWHK